MTESTFSSPPVRFAVVGCGSIAPTHVRAIQGLAPQAELVAVSDLVPEKGRALAEEFGVAVHSFEEILADPEIEAITFCTPSGLHADLGIVALERGKHILVEKPLDVSVEAGFRLRDAAKANQGKLGLISQHRFDPAAQLVQGRIAAGDLGSLFFVETRIPWFRTQEYYDSGDWRGTYAMDGGGCLTNQGIHTVDLMLWLAGPVREVYAAMKTAAHERIEVEDIITATLHFENGAIGTLTASTASYPGFAASLGLFGTGGSALLEGDELHTLAIRGEETVHGTGTSAHAVQVATGGTRSAESQLPEGTQTEWKWGDAHRAQIRDFIEAIRADRAPAVGASDGLRALAVIQASYESARSGQPVAVTRI